VAQQKFTLKKVQANQIIHLTDVADIPVAKAIDKKIAKKDL
jgi:hypothetical protein